MSLEVRRIDHHRVRRRALARQDCKDPVEDADPAPADEAVVERLRRPVDCRRVQPHQPVPDHVNDPRNHPRIIDLLYAARLVRQKRLHACELGFG
jgi:hypothetical protein